MACKRFAGTHSYDKIAKLLIEILTSYGIQNDKVIGTVTDNGSNFVKAFKEFGIGEDSLVIGKQYMFILCV